MRVGLVVPGFSADAQDWCIPALRHLVRSLATTDEARVIAVRYPYRRRRYAIDGADVIAMGGAERRRADVLALWRDVLGLIRTEHRRRPFDILHAFWATESGLLVAIAGRALGVPTLVSLAGGELVGLRDINYGDQLAAWERLKVRASLRLAMGVSAGSRSLLALAERHVPRKRLHRAPLGVDLALFTPAARVHDVRPRKLLHVGTLTRVKDQTTLLRAFARTRDSATLEIVGDGPLRPELEQLARGLRLDGRVTFRGEIDHGRLAAVYRTASAFVVSSRHEAQGMVALEAAACGVPIVGTRVGIVPEVTAAVAPVGAANALAQSIDRTLEEAADQGIAAHVREEFGLRVCTDRFRALYASLTDQQRS